MKGGDWPCISVSIKYDLAGKARTFRAHNTHLTLMGLMLIFTGFYGFYAACLVIQSTITPGWLNIYLSPTTLGAIAFVITFGFAGGFTGGWIASRGDPFWTLSGGLAGVISVSAGADVYLELEKEGLCSIGERPRTCIYESIARWRECLAGCGGDAGCEVQCFWDFMLFSSCLRCLQKSM